LLLYNEFPGKIFKMSIELLMNFILPYKLFTIISQNPLWTSYKHLQTSHILLTNVLKISYEHLTNFLQTSYKHLTNILQTSYKHLTNVLQTSYKLLIFFLQTSNELLANLYWTLNCCWKLKKNKYKEAGKGPNFKKVPLQML
jgi:hypothetical protein